MNYLKYKNNINTYTIKNNNIDINDNELLLKILEKFTRKTINNLFMIKNTFDNSYFDFCCTHYVEIEDDFESLFGIIIRLKANNGVNNLSDIIFLNDKLLLEKITTLCDSGYSLKCNYSFMIRGKYFFCEKQENAEHFGIYLNWLLETNTYTITQP